MANILCLAHYCDTHGPTPLMVTEGLLVDCPSCSEDEDTAEAALSSRRPSTLNPTNIPASHRDARTTSTSPDMENGCLRQDTPPESPRIQTAPFLNPLRRDSSSFRKTYDENDKKRAIPCENCALTLPKKTKAEEGGDISRTKLDTSSPVLRTRKAYRRVAKPHNDPSPPKSASSSDSESAVSSQPAPSSHRRTGSKTLKRQGTASSSGSSFVSTISHDHYLDYTSTHEPLQPASFSIIRQSCLRTLSCETLPPSSTSSTSSPTSPNPFFAHPSSLNSTSSGGPIFFGDPLAGYTTAYIFRIPDPNARGRRRVYALMCLSTHRERVAMKMFSHLAATFKDIANWIQLLAEAELERSESSAMHSPRLNPIDEQNKYRSGSGGSQSTPTSAFLSGRNRALDGKFASMSLRARGLAELVGLPDFFLELHAKFVRLLVELGMIVNS